MRNGLLRVLILIVYDDAKMDCNWKQDGECL